MREDALSAGLASLHGVVDPWGAGGVGEEEEQGLCLCPTVALPAPASLQALKTHLPPKVMTGPLCAPSFCHRVWISMAKSASACSTVSSSVYPGCVDCAPNGSDFP